MKILITEDDLLQRICRVAKEAAGSFYEGPKLQAAAQRGDLEAYFEEFDGEPHLVLRFAEGPLDEDADE